MHASIALAATILASMASAASCNKGGVYCGQSLLNKGTYSHGSRSPPLGIELAPATRNGSCSRGTTRTGKYHDHIVATLSAAGQPIGEQHVQNSIFDCLSGGDIRYVKYCRHGCGGVGSKVDDYCL